MNPDTDLLMSRGLLSPRRLADAERLDRLAPKSRAAIAAICSQRILNIAVLDGNNFRSSFERKWAGRLALVWNLLAELGEYAPVNASLEEVFRAGVDLEDEADHDIAGSVMAAARTLTTGETPHLNVGLERYFDWTLGRAERINPETRHLQEEYYSGRSTLKEYLAAQFAQPVAQEDLGIVEDALQLLDRIPWVPSLGPRLRAGDQKASR